MPTTVNITVGPTGRDFTTVTAALASVNSNLITADEQVNIIIDEQAGGYPEFVTVPTITQSATQYLHIQAAPGDEYTPHTDTGVYFSASRGFSAVITNAQNFTRISGVGAKNTRSLSSSRGIDNFGNDCHLTDVYATTAATATSAVYFLNNANNLVLSNALSVGGSTGFDFGNNSTRTVDKITSIDAVSVGIDTGTASTTITNSLSIGSPDPYLGTFAAGSSNNAGDSTDTPGTSPQNNRTTVDLVDYVGGDYRTASSSALATAGLAGTFIGFALESGGGGGLVVSPTGIPSAEAFGSVTLSVGGVIVSASPVLSAEVVPNPTVSVSGTVLSPSGISSSEAIGSHTLLAGSVVLAPSGIESVEAIGDPTILTGSLTLQPVGIESEEFVPNPELLYAQLVSMSGIGSEEKFGIAIILDGVSVVIPIEDRATYQSIAAFLDKTGKYVSVQNNEIIIEWLKSENLVGRNFNELFYKYLDGLGYAGALSDKLGKWRNDV